jgi:hypothetical protein
MDADDGNGEKSTTTFRWINVARYAVASVVTVLIATVVVIAIKMVVRPDTLIVRVVGGFISVETPPGLLPNHLLLQFKVKADNPSGRAVMYYYNISGYLFDKNISASTSNPQGDCFVSIQIKNKTLQQQQAVYSYTWSTVGPEIMTPSYFYMLYHNRSARIDDVTMRIQGDLVTELLSGYNRTARRTTYYCSPLVVGWAPTTTRGAQDDDEANTNAQGSGLCVEALESTLTSAR